MKTIIDTTPCFRVGDPEPDGYVARIEWAQVHLDAGLRQQRCGSCFMWHFPHQMSDRVYVNYASRTKHGPATVRLEHRYCLDCEKRPPPA